MMKRRDFLARTMLTGAALTAPALLQACAHALRDGCVDGRPNLLFILADDLGYDELGCYGNARVITPRIDAMAAEGLKFTHAIACPMCSPTRSCLLSGRYGYHTTLISNVADPGGLGWELKPEEVTFPRALKTAGYGSAFFGKSHLHYASSAHPDHMRSLGFDETFMFAGDPDDPQDAIAAGGMVPDHFNLKWVRNGEWVGHVEGYDTDVMTNEALAFLRRPRSGPFCMWMPYMAVHEPFQAPQRWLDRYPIDDAMRRDVAHAREVGRARGLTDYEPRAEELQARRAMASTLDENVGRLLDALREQGLERDTLVIFMSDNGGHPLVCGAKASVTDAGVRVPLIMRWPGRIAAGTTSAALAEAVDIPLTLLDAAGVVAPTQPAPDGRSLLPVALGMARDVREMAFTELKGELGLCDHAWFYSALARDGSHERFYPRVTPPVADQQPTPIDQVPAAVVERFRTQMAEHRRDWNASLQPRWEQIMQQRDKNERQPLPTQP